MYDELYVRVQENSTIVISVYREHAFCKLYYFYCKHIINIARVFEIKFSLIVHVVRALYYLRNRKHVPCFYRVIQA